MLVGLQRDEGGGWGRVWRTQDAEAEGGAGGGLRGTPAHLGPGRRRQRLGNAVARAPPVAW